MRNALILLAALLLLVSCKDLDSFFQESSNSRDGNYLGSDSDAQFQSGIAKQELLQLSRENERLREEVETLHKRIHSNNEKIEKIESVLISRDSGALAELESNIRSSMAEYENIKEERESLEGRNQSYEDSRSKRKK